MTIKAGQIIFCWKQPGAWIIT